VTAPGALSAPGSWLPDGIVGRLPWTWRSAGLLAPLLAYLVAMPCAPAMAPSAGSPPSWPHGGEALYLPPALPMQMGRQDGELHLVRLDVLPARLPDGPHVRDQGLFPFTFTPDIVQRDVPFVRLARAPPRHPPTR